jgi:hypothetical protein
MKAKEYNKIKNESKEKLKKSLNYIHERLQLEENFLIYALESFSGKNDIISIVATNVYRARKVINVRTGQCYISVRSEIGLITFSIHEIAKNFRIYKNWEKKLFVE